VATTAAAGCARLIVVARRDPGGRYEWLGPPQPRDVLVTLDGLAHADLAGRGALLFDELEGWEERYAAERRVDELLGAVLADPRVSAIELRGNRLIDFAAARLRAEITNLLRGWRLARAAPGTQDLVCDPATRPALAMGARAALGLDGAAVGYTLAPELPGSGLKRALARPVMRALALRSRPARVRVAAVAAGKLMLALATLSGRELREAGVGAMPFPGIDHGNGAVLALRRRLPLLATFGPAERRPGPPVRLPERLPLTGDEALDRALALLVSRALTAAAPELDGAVRALAEAERASALRAVLLPSAGYGVSQMLLRWAHGRGLRVGVMQHGMYFHRDRSEDLAADVIFCWAQATAEQARDWPLPRPRLVPVGVPGMGAGPPRPGPRASRPAGVPPRRALIASTNAADSPLAPLTMDEQFVAAVVPGLRALASAGVELRWRPHPVEDPRRYRELLAGHGLPVTVRTRGPLPAAAERADVVIASASSAAYEAGALGVAVLMWNSGVPAWIRREYFAPPLNGSFPGMFGDAEEFLALCELLLERPAAGLAVARELGTRLARYAEPFRPVAFAEGLRLLGAER